MSTVPTDVAEMWAAAAPPREKREWRWWWWGWRNWPCKVRRCLKFPRSKIARFFHTVFPCDQPIAPSYTSPIAPLLFSSLLYSTFFLSSILLSLSFIYSTLSFASIPLHLIFECILPLVPQGEYTLILARLGRNFISPAARRLVARLERTLGAFITAIIGPSYSEDDHVMVETRQ